jgi:hypothetical protein
MSFVSPLEAAVDLNLCSRYLPAVPGLNSSAPHASSWFRLERSLGPAELLLVPVSPRQAALAV